MQLLDLSTTDLDEDDTWGTSTDVYRLWDQP